MVAVEAVIIEVLFCNNASMGRAPLLCPPTSDINLFCNLVCRTKVRFVPISGRFDDIASPANTRLHPPECKP